MAGLRRPGVGFRSLYEALDTTIPGGRLVFHVFAALAEFIRELIVEGTRQDLDAARARGQRLGRPPAMTAEQIRQARDLLTLPGNSISSIAWLLGLSRSTIYKYPAELADGHRPDPAGGRHQVGVVTDQAMRQSYLRGVLSAREHGSFSNSHRPSSEGTFRVDAPK